MLYYHFRDTVQSLCDSISEIIENSGPDYDDEVPECVSGFLVTLQFSVSRLNEVLSVLPIELDGYPDKIFGPNVMKSDIECILSIVWPSISRFDNRCPARAHYPVDLYKYKVISMLEFMSLYYSWRCYFHDPRGLDGDIDELLSNLFSVADCKLPLNESIFERIFKNIQVSAEHAQRDIESEFNLPITKI